jgi:hypothetical protein
VDKDIAHVATRSIYVEDEGMTPRVLILAYLVPAKEDAHSKDT